LSEILRNMQDFNPKLDKWIDGEIQELMDNYELDEETAERVWDIMDEYGLNEDNAIKLEQEK